MSSQNTIHLERLLQEVQTGDSLRSPRRRKAEYIQLDFDKAARKDLSNAIHDEFGVQANEGSHSHVVHYTSISSLVSMLKNPKSGYWRMYGTAGSNDPEEGTYVDTVELSDDFPLQPSTYQYAYIASFIQPDDPKNPYQVADNLVFWRSYGREGAGCSLTVPLPRQELLAVKYGRKNTQDSIARLQSATGHLRTTAQMVADKSGVSAQSLDQMMDFTMGKVRYLYKSEAYAYEKECRIVETPLTIQDQNIPALFD